MNNSSWLLVGIVVVVVAFVAFPFLLLAGLNLLGYNVPYTVESWIGAFMIGVFIGVSSITGRNQKR